MNRISLSTGVCLMLLASVASTAGGEPVRVRSRVRLQLNGARLQFAADDSPDFRDLDKDQTFLASGPVSVTFRDFNPLKMAVTVTVDDITDPTHATFGTLLETLLAMSQVLGGSGVSAAASAASKPQSSVYEMENDQARLSAMRRLWGVQEPAPQACRTATEQADKNVKQLTDALLSPHLTVAGLTRMLQSLAEGISNNLARQGGLIALREVVADLGSLSVSPVARRALDDTHPLKPVATALDKIESSRDVIDKELRRLLESPADPCAPNIAMAYMRAQQDGTRDRIRQLLALRDQIGALGQMLAPYGNVAAWHPRFKDEVILAGSIAPSYSSMKSVGVTVSMRTLHGSDEGAIAAKSEPGPAAKFVIRQYDSWVPEIGVGLTFSTADRRMYGTGTNEAGQTVIAEGEPQSSNIEPTLMMNFVCGFFNSSRLRPMFQIGASTSKDMPAILVGGGVRIVGTTKGNFTLGAGFAVPWAKQLKHGITPGTVIDGTAELDKNLEWRLVSGAHAYVNIQYVF